MQEHRKSQGDSNALMMFLLYAVILVFAGFFLGSLVCENTEGMCNFLGMILGIFILVGLWSVLVSKARK